LLLRAWALVAALALPAAGLAQAQAPAQAPASAIVMASTTSTEQSGLFGHLLPAFKQATGIDVRVVAVGTGQALDTGRRGDADVVFVHDTAAEEKFVAEGFATQRRNVMYNDFVLIGPKADPAGTRGADIAAALKKLAASPLAFISRGDKSGTHAAELRLWKAAAPAHIDLHAFNSGDYARAAELFELADRAAPSPAALRSALRNHQAAGRTARAASLAFLRRLTEGFM
jgi:tungstate transport system substrate-binding protein